VKAIKAALAPGKGIRRIARELQAGIGTNQGCNGSVKWPSFTVVAVHMTSTPGVFGVTDDLPKMREFGGNRGPN